MSNTFGKNIKLTLFGQSHSECIGAVLDGLKAGIKIDEEAIKKGLDFRRPYGKISTSRVEEDKYQIVSGVFNGYSTGDPITIIIENTNTRSKDYSELKIKPRPSHADYVAEIKYGGYQDYRGGGHFSGRLTAPIVAFGSLAKKILEDNGIYVGSHIKQVGNILDDSFDGNIDEIKKVNSKIFALLNDSKEKEMMELIEKVHSEGDSIGGIIESEIIGLPVGLGEPSFDSLESLLSHALFSIPAVKGVEFGEGFGLAEKKGSEANDDFYYDGDTVKTKTNNNGGINGGISNGMPVVVRCAIKPTPSISLPQDTVNLIKKENDILEIKGRHDPCIVHRARIVADSMISLVILDMLKEAGKF